MKFILSGGDDEDSTYLNDWFSKSAIPEVKLRSSALDNESDTHIYTNPFSPNLLGSSPAPILVCNASLSTKVYREMYNFITHNALQRQH